MVHIFFQMYTLHSTSSKDSINYYRWVTSILLNIYYTIYSEYIIQEKLLWYQTKADEKPYPLPPHSTQQVIIEGKLSTPCSVDSGVPQSSVLGQLLFIGKLQKIMGAKMQNTSLEVLYVMSISRSKTPPTYTNSLENHTLDKVSEYCIRILVLESITL